MLTFHRDEVTRSGQWKARIGTESSRLRVFIYIVRYKSVSTTTRRIKRAPSTIDHALSHLRTGLSAALVGHAAQHVSLARRNGCFFRRTGQVLSRVSRLRRHLGSHRRAPSKHLHVGTTSPFVLRTVIPCVSRFHQLCPSVRLRLGDGSLVVSLLRRDASVTVHVNALTSSALRTHSLNYDPLRVITDPTCLRRRNAPITITSLARRALLNFARGSNLGR